MKISRQNATHNQKINGQENVSRSPKAARAIDSVERKAKRGSHAERRGLFDYQLITSQRSGAKKSSPLAILDMQQRGDVTTQAVGEEESWSGGGGHTVTSQAIGEEDGDTGAVTSQALGEEDGRS